MSGLLYQIIDAQAELIEVMKNKLMPCFAQDDIDKIEKLTQKIDQLTSELLPSELEFFRWSKN